MLSRGVQHAVAHITCVVRTACAHHRAPLHGPIVVMPRQYLPVAALPSLRVLPRHAIIVRLAALMPVAACVKCTPLSHVPFSARYCPRAATRSSLGPSAARDRHRAHSNYTFQPHIIWLVIGQMFTLHLRYGGTNLAVAGDSII